MTETDTIRLEIPSDFKYLSGVSAWIAEALGRLDGAAIPETTVYNIQLAVHECCANIIDHAYSQQAGRIRLALTLSARPRQVTIELEDTGRSFDPEATPPPDLEQAQIRGYGLFLMKSLMDEVVYIPSPGNNYWRLVKTL